MHKQVLKKSSKRLRVH